jgi:hypothetical protein
MNKWLTAWINQSMNKRMYEWMNNWLTESINDEWMNNLLTLWMNQWLMNAWITDCLSCCLTDWLTVWVTQNDKLTDWLTDWQLSAGVTGCLLTIRIYGYCVKIIIHHVTWCVHADVSIVPGVYIFGYLIQSPSLNTRLYYASTGLLNILRGFEQLQQNTVWNSVHRMKNDLYA